MNYHLFKSECAVHKIACSQSWCHKPHLASQKRFCRQLLMSRLTSRCLHWFLCTIGFTMVHFDKWGQLYPTLYARLKPPLSGMVMHGSHRMTDAQTTDHPNKIMMRCDRGEGQPHAPTNDNNSHRRKKKRGGATTASGYIGSFCCQDPQFILCVCLVLKLANKQTKLCKEFLCLTREQDSSHVCGWHLADTQGTRPQFSSSSAVLGVTYKLNGGLLGLETGKEKH